MGFLTRTRWPAVSSGGVCLPLGSWSSTTTQTSWSWLVFARSASPSTLWWSWFQVGVAADGGLRRFIVHVQPPLCLCQVETSCHTWGRRKTSWRRSSSFASRSTPLLAWRTWRARIVSTGKYSEVDKHSTVISDRQWTHHQRSSHHLLRHSFCSAAIM